MKNLLIPCLICLSALGVAQPAVTITEGMVAIDGMSRNALSVVIKGADAEELKKAWKKQLKDLKGKVSDKTSIFADNCQAKSMGSNTFDVYSLVEAVPTQGVKLIAAFDLGGAYLSTAAHPAQYPAAEKIIYDFALEQTKVVIGKEVEDAKKTLGSMEKGLSALGAEKAALEAAIVDHYAKIAAAQLAIGENASNQVLKQKEIDGQKSIITDLELKLGSIH